MVPGRPEIICELRLLQLTINRLIGVLEQGCLTSVAWDEYTASLSDVVDAVNRHYDCIEQLAQSADKN